ncbi:MAG: hypothetical protein WC238_00035 [Parcubacteria group bacterium]|jgi:hypothetical protein
MSRKQNKDKQKEEKVGVKNHLRKGIKMKLLPSNKETLRVLNEYSAEYLESLKRSEEKCKRDKTLYRV